MLVASVALLVAAAFGLAVSIKATAAGLHEVQRLQDARREAESLLSLLKDVETGQRGFTATGDPLFLEPYDGALPQVGSTLDALRASMPGDAFQRLGDLVRDMLRVNARMVALTQDDLDAARRATDSGEGKRIMDAIRAEVAALTVRANGHIAEVERRIRDRSLIASVLALLASILACTITGAAALIIQRRAEKRVRVAEIRRRKALAESRRSAAARQESEEHHRQMADLNPQVLWTAGPDGAVLDVNERWHTLTGVGAGEALGAGWTRVPHPEDLPAMLEAWTWAVRTGEPYDVEHRVRLADGQFRWMRSRAFAQRASDGRVTRWYGVTEDVHDRRLAEQQRAEMHGELLHATRVSTMGEVAGALAHELNQPLGAVLGYIDGCRALLGSGRLDARDIVLNALEQAHAQAVRAGNIIRRLRDYLAKARGERRLCHMNALIREAARLALSRSDRAGITVIWRLATDLPPVLVDPVEIQQVVVNLLRNAVEAMERGVERAELTIETHFGDDARVEVAIADTGAGIGEDVAQDVFRPFVTTKPNGMGLGLSICRSIIEAHGGCITVEPNPSGGTVVRFALPEGPRDA